jgi:hypothetical protein
VTDIDQGDLGAGDLVAVTVERDEPRRPRLVRTDEGIDADDEEAFLPDGSLDPLAERKPQGSLSPPCLPSRRAARWA